MSRFYSKLFASVYDRIMNPIEKSLFSIRQDLLMDLKGDILEIGVGTGVNFKFYSPLEVRVIAIDPSEPMIRRAKNRVPDQLDIKFFSLGVTDLDFIKMVENIKFDAIVCTLVLCTIPDPEKSIKLFYELLKDDGKLIVLEHIQHHNSWIAKWYNFVNPFWNIIGDGCNLNRHTDQLLKETGFVSKNQFQEQYFKRSIPFYKNIMIKATIKN